MISQCCAEKPPEAIQESPESRRPLLFSVPWRETARTDGFIRKPRRVQIETATYLQNIVPSN
jgi:hypothetical protein